MRLWLITYSLIILTESRGGYGRGYHHRGGRRHQRRRRERHPRGYGNDYEYEWSSPYDYSIDYTPTTTSYVHRVHLGFRIT